MGSGIQIRTALLLPGMKHSLPVLAHCYAILI